jgi:ATP-dependent DNA helicase PIF1
LARRKPRGHNYQPDKYAGIDFCKHGVNAKFCVACGNVADSKLSEDQQAAVRAILEEKGPFFLTGPAGSGKSFVIEHLRSTVKGCYVTATTGTAAMLIRGRTLHSFAGIHPNYGVVMSKKADARIRNAKILIVDEVSMLDAKLLDQIFQRFKYACHTPKLVLVGDFMQLPPVDGACIFDSPKWSEFRILKLNQQHRQRDESFISALNDMRVGKLSDRALALIQSRTVSELPDDCTHLMAHRADVSHRNMNRLSALPGQRYASDWLLTFAKKKDGTPHEVSESEISRSRFPSKLFLKEQARVVMLTNDKEGRWVNGSTGVVLKVQPGMVTVKLDNGKTVPVMKDTDEILNSDGMVVCTITQYPMQLAWALTIHKAQGMSMDRVGVDLSHHFAPGQTYVAISRCRSTEGLFLKGTLSDLMANEAALKYA